VIRPKRFIFHFPFNIFHFAIALQKEAFPTLIMGNEKFQMENEPVATAPGSVTQAAPATQSFAI